MTLEKAIENNKEILSHGSMIDDPNDNASIKLGIEALKRCKALAEYSPLWAAKPLPGETED